VLVTTETLVKLLAFVNCCLCQNVMVGNEYTDKLICRGYTEREGSNDDFD